MNLRNQWLRTFVLLACAASASFLVAAERPNVVVIYFDDTGWTDFGCFGGDVDTPNVDRLAEQGLRLTNYYSPAPNCSPSRAGLLTGRFPFRAGVYNYLPPNSVMHLPDAEVTVAEVLQNVGYATGMFGKWHLSLLESEQPNPQDQGFDYWFACDNNLVKRNPKKLIRNGTPVPNTEGWAAQVVADEANRWMKDQTEPFLAYVAFSETHSPHDAPADLQTKYTERGESKKRAVYKGMTEYSDAAVGSILNTLDEMGAAENTIVFLASDNGPTSAESCVGLRGKKSFTWEGGIRVPAIIRWPGHIEPGSTTDQPVGGIDLLPTLCDIAKTPLPNKKIDGVSIRSLLEGNAFQRKSPLLAFFYRTSPAASMRFNDYVLIAHSDDEQRKKTHSMSAPDMPKVKSTELVEFKLYNVRDDLSQMKDLASEQPKVLEKLRARMVALHKEALQEGPVWDFSAAKRTK